MEPQIKRHEPLYLKHRPQALDQLVGQESVVRTLTNAINFDRISHAYLFTGPRGTGKTSSARILAKSLNCKAGDKATPTPCQQCVSCIEIKTGNSPAVFEIDAASNNSVDDARILIERAPLVAPGGRYKIYIIDECHMLTKEAFNALLKTIEDPPPNVVFVLATTEEHKVLPTIVSRCQRLMFRLVQQEDLLVHLRNVANQEEIAVTDRAIDFIARRSGGGLRDALGLLDQASLLSTPENPVDVAELLTLLGALNEDVLIEMSLSVLERRGQDLLLAANKLLHQGREPAIVVQELARHFLNLTKASYLHDATSSEVAEKLIIGSPDYVSSLYEQAPKFERSELSQLVEVLDRLEQTCRRTTQPGMHLEVGLLSLCHRQDMLIVRELSERVARLEQALASGATLQGASARPAAAAPSARPAAAPVAQQAPARPQPQAEPAQYSRPAAAAPASTQSAPRADVAGASRSMPDEYDREDGFRAAPPRNEPPAQERPAAAPPRPAAVANDEDSETGLPPDEVDRIWEDMLAELQRKHIPTFSLISVHGFPITLTETELTVGVTTESFQKNLENRLEHVKNACAQVMGKPLFVKVKVVTREPVAAARPTAAPRERSMQAAPAMSGAPGPDGDEDSERRSLAARPTRPMEPPPPSRLLEPPDPPPPMESEPFSPDSARNGAESSSASQTASRRLAESDGTAAAPIISSDPRAAISAEELVAQTSNSTAGTIIKEAYKLFEGPGSRLLGN